MSVDSALSQVKFGSISIEHDVESLFTVWEKKELWERHVQKYPLFKAMDQWHSQRALKITKKTYEKEMLVLFAVSSKVNYEKWWNQADEDYREIIEDCLETSVEGYIFGYMGISPVQTHFLEEKSFLCPFFAREKEFFDLVARKVFLFYFYKKGEDMGLDTTSYDFWIANELLAPVVITEKRATDIFGRLVRKSSIIVNPDIFNKVEKLYKKRVNKEISAEELVLKVCNIASETTRT